MGLLQSINGLPKPIRYSLWGIVVGIPAIGIGAIIYDVSMGDQHKDATYVPPLINEVHLCPSLRNNTKKDFSKSAAKYRKETNCLPPTIVDDLCVGAPGPGIMQVRSCNDIVSSYPAGCPTDYVDTVSFNDLGTSGVTYLEQTSINIVHHTLGHIIGLGRATPERKDGHSTRINSVMYYKPGHSFDDISCQ